MHAELSHAPGVPLEKITPAWIPFAPLWVYLTGTVLFVAGLTIFLGKRARVSAAFAGLVMALLTLFVYLPILAAAKPTEITEGLNYVGDTALFAGRILLLASAVQRDTEAV